MTNRRRVFIIGAATLAMACTIPIARAVVHPTIDYRGEQVRLARWHFAYDDYQNAVEKLHPSELARVRQLVTGAPIDTAYDDIMALVAAISEIKFPGYGQSGLAETPQPDGSVLTGQAVEVPEARLDRLLIFRRRGERYTLVADVLASLGLPIEAMHLRGDTLEFVNAAGQAVHRAKVTPRLP